MNTFQRITPQILLVVFLFVVSCAHRQSPSGGPDDKTGPSSVIQNPPSGSVNVSRDVRISITFSEWLLPASEKGVTLFPSTPLKAKVKGRRLEIRPLQRLNDSTTYHLVITSGLKDLRNNQMSKPLSIVFSTGPTLDSGSLSGCVADPQRRLLQPAVALFRRPSPPGDSGFCGPPSFLALTDSSGRFTFENIRTGFYALLAWLDKNSDSRLQTGEELYLPVDSIISVGTTPVNTLLYPARFDTSRQSIASVTAIDNRTIVGQWKKPWDSLVCPQLPQFILQPADTGSPATALHSLITNGTPRIVLLPDSALDSTNYLLIYSFKSIFDTAMFKDTLRLAGTPQPDTAAPFLTGSSPKTGADLHPEIRLFWSEPVSASFPLVMADTLGDTIALSGDSTAADTTLLTPGRALLPGHTYRTIFLSGQGKDLSGNPLRSRDSTDTASVITISAVIPDSIAVSLQGGAPCLETTPMRKWQFTPLAGHRSFTVPGTAATFRFDSLPAAKGRISTFIDLNGNDRRDDGRLLPFVAPEPFVMFEDTVEARARWDVEGVELGPCDPCYRRPVEDSTAMEE
ncbi:MAG: Ig-like domain-containing protein [Chitinispirillaceae bacterium]|nr:Ig-like domain-containing protein [Chitinispirillaceae bacterium]